MKNAFQKTGKKEKKSSYTPNYWPSLSSTSSRNNYQGEPMDVDAITLDKSKLECFNCGRKGVPLQPSATTNSNPQMTASPTEVPPGSTQAPNPACTKEATTSTPATTALAQD